MSGLLRGILVLLVLIDLGFVHITGSADLVWLGPLAALTLASPFLLPLRRFLIYRLAWNAAILAAFALLVRHATTAGVAYLLEDGLLLAALCQVHLLNNIGPEQKPDLIFFNSFLIPVVTSFLSLDVAYSGVFLAYAPVLVIGLMVHTADRNGSPATRGVARRVLVSGAGRAIVATGLTLIAFFLVPRDFTRKGLLGERLDWRPGDYVATGFNDRIDLSQGGRNAGGGDRVVMTATLRRGSPAEVPAAWRGATLVQFDGERWRAHPAGGGDGFRPVRGGFERRRVPAGPELAVSLREGDAGRLFLPLSTRRVEPGGFTAIPLEDLTFVHVRRSEAPVYSLVVSPEHPEFAGAGADPAAGVPPVFTELRAPAPRSAALFAARIRSEVGPDAPPHVLVESMRRFLAERYQWLPPGTEDAAGSLEEFLDGAAGGHCEYFATALAVMLRLEGIPCRVVTGFRSTEWDEAGRVLTFRDRHAHAWVEVHDPAAGWYTVDPSPPAGDGPAAGDDGFLATLAAGLSDGWSAVVNFTDDGRRKVGAWFAALPGRIFAAASRQPLPFAGVAALLGALLVFRRLRRRPARPVRELIAAARRARLAFRPGETPRELLERARRSAVSNERLSAMAAAVDAHEAFRYAPRGSAGR